MKKISASEWVIDDKVYHIINPEWIFNLVNIMESNYDSNPPKDQETARS